MLSFPDSDFHRVAGGPSEISKVMTVQGTNSKYHQPVPRQMKMVWLI
jgi:hypothetical protein